MNEILNILWEQIKPEFIVFIKVIVGSVLTLLVGKFAFATILKKGVTLLISLLPWLPIRSMAWGLVRTVISKHPYLNNSEKFNKVFDDIKRAYPFFPTSIIKAYIESAYEEFRAEVLGQETVPE